MNAKADDAANRSDVGWCYDRDGQAIGPFATEDLAALAKAGLIHAGTILIRQDGQRLAADHVMTFDTLPPSSATPPNVETIEPSRAATSSPSNIPLPPPPPDAPIAVAQLVAPPPPPDARQSTSPFVGQVPLTLQPAPSTPAAPSDVDVQWTRLREVARWQRMVNLAFAGGLAMIAMAKGIATIARTPVIDSVMGPLSFVMVTAFWVWLIVKLARATETSVWLYGVLGVIPGLNFLLLLQLSQRASGILREAGIRVGFLGTELPELPPAWFQPLASPFKAGAATASTIAPIAKSRPPRLVVWRKRFFRGFVLSLLTGVVSIGGLVSANPGDGIWSSALMVVGWLSILVALASFVFYVVIGILQVIVGAGKAIAETTAASLPRGGLKPPR